MKSLNLTNIAIGASITACRGTGRHIVALEEDESIFKEVLLAMKKAPPVQAVPEAPAEEFGTLDLDAVHMEPMVFTRNVRPCK